MVIFLWIALTIVCTIIASKKGRSEIGFFLLSLFLSPLLGLVILLILGANEKKLEIRAIVAGAKKICPSCAEVIKKEAAICKFCDHDFEEKKKKEIKENIINELKTPKQKT